MHSFLNTKLLIRALGYERYSGLQLVLKGLDTIYVLNNPVLNIARDESLSRTRDEMASVEYDLMKVLIRNLLGKQ